MYKILSKNQFSEKVFCLEIEAPLIARSCKPGNFVIVRVDNRSERVPYTIAKSDPGKGTLTMVIQEVGLSSTKLCRLNPGDSVHDIVGPLGTPSRIENYGTVVCAGGGIGIAAILPILTALKKAGNRVISVLAGRTKELVIMIDDVKAYSDELIIMTDDGSLGQKGVVTVGVEEVLKREHVDKVLAIGPPVMMKFTSLLAHKYGVPNDVSLNTIMVDGTGMCGACRLTIGGKTRFVCIDGPEFNGDEVDWNEMMSRMKTFKGEEAEEMQHYADHVGNVEVKVNEKKIDYQAIDLSKLTAEEPLKAKDRMKIPRVKMPELDPVYRATTRIEEVNIGLTPEMAVREARRCLNCKHPSCVEGCPVNINIPGFIKEIEKGDFLKAASILKETSALPAVCGRVCPQEKQCESRCIHHKMNSEPVAIGYLERFAADYERESGKMQLPVCQPSNGIKVAVVGSGPSGLSFAGDMVKRGFEVYVFEALHEIGGVLKYGIPEFRLPNRIVDVEIDNLRKMGVHFQTDCIIGKTITVEELEEKGFKGIFVGSGAGLPNFMNIPGENYIDVLSSNEYLTRVNLMDAANPDTDTPINIGKKVLVVGGGNTAMDSCRTAKRLGGDVTLVYRRSEAEMPARREEVKHAKEEGIHFLTLHNPKEYLADENGRVKAAVLDVMELGEPDQSGRRRPVATGKTITIDCDQVIVAVGVSPNPLVPKSIPGLELGRKNTIVVNDEMQSSRGDIYAGGDIVRGGATVILAMGDGRRAAAHMTEHLLNAK
ncbi:bifunctional dihydroorotate dehydrogenase B NAD binding subunit/NADPH-dependent glutamate synthase [Prevotella sp. AGR2160]|uniref:bifunctional dihydroorotate dehydrogenase B NAD binding subunit/NADPH-dependent glutamate synthase n=1 Tax=Prevotella sp. AGR2160 TaxID=1280674 RepID=UPI00042489A9|nr:bifunctional dihydroorotate dehydrogenase B NAD binding subunit/NADPH-dependent glutamate synthase [Prevotella sp. AGR2160]